MLRDGALEQFYPYQRDGVEWMRKRGAYILGDEPGLGKSVQALADFAQVRTHRQDARLLLVAPNTVILKWSDAAAESVNEIEKWTTFTYDVSTGTAKQRARAIESGADITVIAYDNIARELDRLNEQGFYMLAFDEAHNIKNRKALRTQAAFNLRGARRALITGSPMLNRVDELWSLLFMVAPTEFPNYWWFVNRYAVWGGYEGREIVGVQNVGELRAKMEPYLLRRTLADVAQHIPPLSVDKVYVENTPAQRKAYEQARDELKVEFEGEMYHEFGNPAVKFLRLSQICNTLAAVGGPDESAKLDRAVDLVGEIGDHKIVIFSKDVATLRCMRARLTKVGVNAPVICGTDEDGRRMDARARQPIIDAFQSKREPRVLLASYGVAREGIDLYAAHYAIKLDKLYVPELDTQATKRLHRTGQIHPVVVYEMFVRNTVESRIEKILSTKRATFDSVIGEDAFLTTMLREHVHDLLVA